MANFFRGKFLLRNGDFVDSSLLPEKQDKLLYEVLRVINHVPLFWKEHYQRLLCSAKLATSALEITEKQFAANLKKLIQKSRFQNGNIRILVTPDSNNQQNYFYFVPHNYPTPEDYENGVKLGVLHAERKQPQAKIIQHKLRSRANQLILEEDFHEVLLTNHKNQVTEGSRSNIFFVKGDTFYTPPSEQVLRGITREKVIECLALKGYKFVEEFISATDIDQFDAAFLTGTSPKVLPVSQIDGIQFDPSNQFIKNIKLKFEELIDIEVLNNHTFFHS